MECDSSDKHGITIPAMVTIGMLLNDIPHVWHRLVANQEIIAIINLMTEL